MEQNIWEDRDLWDLDAKFDALAEYLNLEFVFERVSDGSDIADVTRCYARPKTIEGLKNATIAPPSAPVSQEKTPEPPEAPEELAGVEPPPLYEKKKHKKYTDY